MKRLLAYIFIIGVVLGACGKPGDVYAALGGGTNVHNHSGAAVGGGSLNLSGALSSTKECATGYTRVIPNYCRTNSSTSFNSLTGACSPTVALAGVTDAKAVVLLLSAEIRSANAIGNRFMAIQLYPPADVTCLTILTNIRASQYEFVAIAVETSIQLTETIHITPSNSAGQANIIATECATCYGGYYIMGYID